MKTLALIVPCFNEADVLRMFYDETTKVIDSFSLSNFSFMVPASSFDVPFPSLVVVVLAKDPPITKARDIITTQVSDKINLLLLKYLNLSALFL